MAGSLLEHHVDDPLDWHYCYSCIIESRGQDPLRDTHGYPFSLYALRQDFLHGKVVWTNYVWADLWRYFGTNHSLLSIFFTPEHHPYTRLHRIIILFSSFCLSVMCSAIIVAAGHDLSLGQKIQMSIASSLIIIFFSYITKFCLVCSCCENFDRNVRCCCRMFGCLIAVYFQLFTAIVYLITGIAILSENKSNNEHFWVIWIVSNNLSFVLEALLLLILFGCSWRYEHQSDDDLGGRLRQCYLYHITFDEYEQWLAGNLLRLSFSESSQNPSIFSPVSFDNEFNLDNVEPEIPQKMIDHYYNYNNRQGVNSAYDVFVPDKTHRTHSPMRRNVTISVAEDNADEDTSATATTQGTDDSYFARL